MRYSEEEIQAMTPAELEELIEKEEKMTLSNAAKTIIDKNKPSTDEQELLRKIRKE